MFCHFRSKIRVCGNRYHTFIFKDKDKRKIFVYAEKNGLQNSYLGFLKVRKFWKFEIFQHIFYICKTSSKISKLTNRNICTRIASKECMYQVSNNSLHIRCYYSILNVKNGFFSGHFDLDVQYHAIIYIHFIPISMQQTMF